MVIFQYNLYIYIFVWKQHGCLTNTVCAMDTNNSVIKRLWCIKYSNTLTHFYVKYVRQCDLDIPKQNG